MTEEIKDYHRYTTLMRNGFYDKLFFADKLFGGWKTMLDYGCADGFLTKIIAETFPDKTIYGFDDNTNMSAMMSTGSNPANAYFTGIPVKTDVLLLSSVIHEVYNYKKPPVQDFWDYVFRSGFKYIVIRDMIWRAKDEYPNIMVKAQSNIIRWCEENSSLGELHRYESMYGSLSMVKSLVHFLLKYLYMSSPNWNRELKEDYLKFNYIDLLEIIPSEYRVIYQENYKLPYLEYKWEQDFGITNIRSDTHTKIILKLRK